MTTLTLTLTLTPTLTLTQVKGGKPRMTICRLCEEQVPTNNPNSLLGSAPRE